MLHDPGSRQSLHTSGDIEITAEDRQVLRSLGETLSEIASDPIHREKALLWTKVNDRQSSRPVVYINELPWHELNVDDELTLQCTGTWAMDLEQRLRREIYQWRHMPADMVVSPFFECPLSIKSTSFGITEDVDIARTDDASGVYSRHFNRQIKEPEDLEKIKMPTVTYDEAQSAQSYAAMVDLFADLMPIKKVGQSHIWFTPWDFLIRWWGIQEAMIDLVMRPEMVHDGVERMVGSWMTELDQFEEHNLLSLDCRNIRVGSGGYGYTNDLPGDDYDPEHVKPKNMWGCSNAQIFSEVSPEMHWEFAVEHDLKWLERWGMTYYGCCEPLDKKIDVMRRIPNLRKISVSPWNDIQKVVDSVGDDYVLSVKPSPAIFASDHLDADRARTEIAAMLDVTNGKSHVELIMKDVSTVKYNPQQLWEWARIAMETVQEYRGP
jgi:hypothetical protein